MPTRGELRAGNYFHSPFTAAQGPLKLPGRSGSRVSTACPRQHVIRPSALASPGWELQSLGLPGTSAGTGGTPASAISNHTSHPRTRKPKAQGVAQVPGRAPDEPLVPAGGGSPRHRPRPGGPGAAAGPDSSWLFTHLLQDQEEIETVDGERKCAARELAGASRMGGSGAAGGAPSESADVKPCQPRVKGGGLDRRPSAGRFCVLDPQLWKHVAHVYSLTSGHRRW